MPVFRSILEDQGDGSFVLRWQGVSLRLRDVPGSTALESIAQDFLCNRYAFDEVVLRPGDFMLDIGAHAGAVSIFFALKCPEATIHAYEPIPRSFGNLLWGLEANGIRNVVPWNDAITADGRALALVVPGHNTGSATAFAKASQADGATRATSVTVSTALRRASRARCQFLKMDCEGMEHEILSDERLADRVDALAIEIHDSEAIRQQGYDAEALALSCRNRFGGRLLRSSVCRT